MNQKALRPVAVATAVVLSGTATATVSALVAVLVASGAVGQAKEGR